MGIPCIPQKNHIALLAACFPSAKALANAAPNWAPDSNAVGRLTYYGSNRPQKLPKVANALLERVRAQSRQRSGQARTAGLVVSLGVLQKLIAECGNDLGLFAPQALEIVQLAVDSKDASGRPDVEIIEKASESVRKRATANLTSQFYALTTVAQAATLASSSQVVHLYGDVLQRFARLVTDTSVAPAQLVGLHAVDGAVSSELFYAGQDKQRRSDAAAKAIVRGLLASHSEAKIDLFSATLQGNEKVDSRPKAADRARAINVTGSEKRHSSADVAKAARTALRAALQTADGSSLVAFLGSIVSELAKVDDAALWTARKTGDAWIAQLAQATSVWTPLQYRFHTVNVWLDGFERNAQSPLAAAHLATLTAVLRGPASQAGLAVGDVLSRLLLYISGRQTTTTSAADVVAAIAALASRSYYPDQIGDIVQDIANSASTADRQARVGKDHADPLAVHARAIEAALSAADAPSSRTVHAAVPAKESGGEQPLMRESESGTRAPVRPDAMQEGLFLLSEPSEETRIAFQRALVIFIRNELPRRVRSNLVESASDASLARFMHGLAIAIYTVTTSATLGEPGSRAVSAGVDEYSTLATIAVGAIASRAASATVALTPAADAVSRTASTVWANDRARANACRALSDSVLSAARETWASGSGLDGLAASADLQKASGLDATDLRDALLGNWTVERASDQANLITLAASSRDGRRQTAIYTFSPSSPARSIRSTSVADLRATLGQPTSNGDTAPSIASFQTTDTKVQRRKSARIASQGASRADQLAALTGGERSNGKPVFDAAPYA